MELALNKKAEIGSKKWKDLRLAVLARDGYICYVCGAEADQVDHIYPRSKGGSTFDQFNCASICRRCNLAKGGRFFNKPATPPVFSNCLSPTQSEPMLDSPFKTRPEPI
jgi:5-methylcytosine-specific restriction endonuclease McrA